MGRKGVSKRKPKKSRPFSSADIGGSSNVRSSEGPVVQSLVNNSRNSFNRGGLKSPTGSNNKDRKGY
jgi:hypothetical protein